jgi:hypothetical protein
MTAARARSIADTPDIVPSGMEVAPDPPAAMHLQRRSRWFDARLFAHRTFERGIHVVSILVLSPGGSDP